MSPSGVNPRSVMSARSFRLAGRGAAVASSRRTARSAAEVIDSWHPAVRTVEIVYAWATLGAKVPQPATKTPQRSATSARPLRKKIVGFIRLCATKSRLRAVSDRFAGAGARVGGDQRRRAASARFVLCRNSEEQQRSHAY